MIEKMKILIVCQHYYPENFVIYKIAESLLKEGHDITVLTGKPNYGYDDIIPEYKNVSYEEINGVKVHRVDIH
ncbi:MAG: glycosyltransferase WbuB, partial [Bacilli bacterium]|nr:glycosyltransferase WbuB [Bacilli bacterium]